MQGSLGIGANLNKWTPDDFATAKQLVADYKKIRETVQHGSLYRLISPQHDSEDSATESVALTERRPYSSLSCTPAKSAFPTRPYTSMASIRTANTACVDLATHKAKLRPPLPAAVTGCSTVSRLY